MQQREPWRNCLQVSLRISYPHGRKKLTPDDLQLSDLVDEDVVRLGWRRIYPISWYRQFRSIEVGTRQLLDKWTHPTDPTGAKKNAQSNARWRFLASDALLPCLEDIERMEARFQETRTEFLQKLPEARESATNAWLHFAQQVAYEKRPDISQADLEQLIAKERSKFDIAFDQLSARVRDAFQWDLTIEAAPQPPDIAQFSVGEAVQSSAVREAILTAKRKMEDRYEQIQVEISDAIRERIIETFEEAGRKLQAGKKSKDGAPKSMNAWLVQGLQNAVEMARLTNPWGDPDLQQWLDRFKAQWLEGQEPKELAARYRNRENLSGLQEAIDTMVGDVRSLAERATKRHRPGEGEGRRKLR